LRVLVLMVSVVLFACGKDDASAKKEAERLRLEVEALKAEKAVGATEKAHADTEAARLEMQRENERLKAELDAAKQVKPPTETKKLASGKLVGRKVIDEFRQLKENQQLSWKMTAGRYRVRATASSSGLVIKWVGASCPNSKEVKIYDELCEIDVEAQLSLSNPGGITGTGPTEQVAITVTQM